MQCIPYSGSYNWVVNHFFLSLIFWDDEKVGEQKWAEKQEPNFFISRLASVKSSNTNTTCTKISDDPSENKLVLQFFSVYIPISGLFRRLRILGKEKNVLLFRTLSLSPNVFTILAWYQFSVAQWTLISCGLCHENRIRHEP